MKPNFKKSFIALCALGLSSTAFALYLPNTNPGASSTGNSFFGVEGMYLQANSSDMSYAAKTTGNPIRTRQVESVDPDYEFSFSIWAGYYLANRKSCEFDLSCFIKETGVSMTPVNMKCEALYRFN